MSGYSNKQGIDETKIRYSLFNPSLDDFSVLDFKYENSDPLNVDAFIHGNPWDYVNNNISKIYVVRYEGKLIGFFTLSMSHLEIKHLNDVDKHPNIKFNYPSLLLGQMGVATGFRERTIGPQIITFCIGIGLMLNQKIGCALLILNTSKVLAEKYYEPTCNFNWKKSEKEMVWMYIKLHQFTH